MPKHVLFIITTCIFIADQISKWAVTELILRPAYLQMEGVGLGLIEWYTDLPERLPSVKMKLLPFFNLTLVWNEGVSFGMMAQNTDLGVWFLVALSLVIVVWFGSWLVRTNVIGQQIAICMVIAGALGNVIDRLRFGAVIDFLDFHAFGWHYPAFNIADSCIVIGVFILIFYAFFLEKTIQD